MTFTTKREKTVIDIAKSARLKSILLRFSNKPRKTKNPLVIVDSVTEHMGTPPSVTITSPHGSTRSPHNAEISKLKQTNAILVRQLHELTKRLQMTQPPSPRTQAIHKVETKQDEENDEEEGN